MLDKVEWDKFLLAESITLVTIYGHRSKKLLIDDFTLYSDLVNLNSCQNIKQRIES